MNFARFFVSVFLILFFISRVDSVVFDCYTRGDLIVICSIDGVKESTTVTRIEAENPSETCYEGVNYFYSYDARDHRGYIAAFYGCGGKFKARVETTPHWNSWTAWSACSVSCGEGQRGRTRTCSTGETSDCYNGKGWDNQWTSCGGGSCHMTPAATPLDLVCSRPSLQYRILGGQEANECQYPWMVMFYNRRARTFCGGTIIDANHILTAAHCVRSENYIASPSDLTVVSGATWKPTLSEVVYGTRPSWQYSHMTFRYVSQIKRHAEFDPKFLTNDVAVLTLTEPIVFDKCHVPICLPSVNPNLSRCKVMGWGTTSNGKYARTSPKLLYTDVNVIGAQTCVRTFGSWYFNGKRQICVGGNGRGSCKGDSGGPLICPGPDGRYFQYGIVSGGAVNECGTVASFYTKVSNYHSWIKANTN